MTRPEEEVTRGILSRRVQGGDDEFLGSQGPGPSVGPLLNGKWPGSPVHAEGSWLGWLNATSARAMTLASLCNQ